MTPPFRQRPPVLSACAGLLLLLFVGIARTGLAQDAVRGAALMALAQQTVGGAKGLAAVRTLQVTGTFRRVVGTMDTEGDFDVFIELPDKYLRSEKTGTPGQPSTERIEALVGGVPRDAVRGGRGVGAGGGPAVLEAGAPVDSGDAGASPDAGRAGPPGEVARDGVQSDGPPADPAATPVGRGRGGAPDPDAQHRARRAEVSRLRLMWLLGSDTPLTWVGTAQSPDGTADVLEVRYADEQPTRLFLESKTHTPLMLQWTAAPAAAGGGGRRGGGRLGAAPPEGAGAPQGGPAQPSTLSMTFSDYRVVNGLRLPFAITRGSNGQTTEQWTVSRYRVNPSFGPETFSR